VVEFTDFSPDLSKWMNRCLVWKKELSDDPKINIFRHLFTGVEVVAEVHVTVLRNFFDVLSCILLFEDNHVAALSCDFDFNCVLCLP
jgi:hypothetical protein